MDATYFIYALSEPDSRLIGYVGQTTNPRDRFRQHIATAIHKLWQSRFAKDHWLAALAEDLLVPSLEILEVVEATQKQARAREKAWQWWIRDHGRCVDGFDNHCFREGGYGLPGRKCDGDYIEPALNLPYRRREPEESHNERLVAEASAHLWDW